MFNGADRLVARSIADSFLELRVEDADGEIVSSFHLFDRIDEFLFQLFYFDLTLTFLLILLVDELLFESLSFVRLLL